MILMIKPSDFSLTRRDLLGRCGMGMGALAFSNMVVSADQDHRHNPMAPRGSHFPGRAKRVIHLFMNGGPSHVDSFDPKPALQKFHGKKLPIPVLPTERKTGAAFGSPFKHRKWGQSGIEATELFPNICRSIDDLCIIRSMHADVPNHEPSLGLMNCGEARQIRPSMGSWVTYGLGTENQNLPGFVVMCPNGYPIQESQNWQSAFLPGACQGTHIDTRHVDVQKLIENVRNTRMAPELQRAQLDLLQALNRRHQAEREDDGRLNSRIHSFELAYRMQMEATDAFDVSREPRAIREMYGSGTQGRQMLIARRLVERGVRFVQVWTGKDQPWDSHDDIEASHGKLARQTDQPIGALLTDLKQRGMLDDTLVIWGGEFGRTPTVELPKAGSNKGKVNGRDHNHHGFTMWLAGGGIRGGHVHGATDEFGFAAVKDRVHVHDLHATILHLLGFDHEKLTYRYGGRDFRLTDVYGNVVHDLLS